MKKEKLFTLTQEQLKPHLNNILNSMGYQTKFNKGFLYAQGDYPVLLIAHMDTVHKDPVKTICKSDSGNIWMSPEGIGGDDRAGIYMVLEVIKQVRCHVLFCEDEEIGGIGASKFVNGKIKPKVNYIVEFDRRGSNDAVFYDCDNPDFTKFVEGFGFKTASGSFSDISIVAPALKVAAVNLSSGYYNAHTNHEYIVWSEINQNIKRAVSMIKTKTEKFKYIEAVHVSKYASCYGGWKTYDNSYSKYLDYWEKDWMSYTNQKKSDSKKESKIDYHLSTWEEWVCEFDGTIVNDYGDDMISGFDGMYMIDRADNVYELSPCGAYAMLMDGYHPVLNDGVTHGYCDKEAFEVDCVFEEDYYNYLDYSGIAV